MSELDWEQQGQQAQSGLDPLRFLVGTWNGTGRCHGDAVTGTFTVNALLDGSWLQATETMLDEAGKEVHSDLAFYRYNVEAETLHVLQLFEHGHQMTTPVELTDDGFRWVTGPGAPQLRYHHSNDSLTYRVIFPGEEAPAIEMTYKRA